MGMKVQDDLTSYPLPDLIHVLGEDVVHVPQVRSQEWLLGLGRALLFLTARTKITETQRKRLPRTEQTRRRSNVSGRFLLERDDGRSGADVSGHRVQDLHGVLQLQLLIERHDAGLGPVVSDQDPPQDAIVKLHKSEWK